MNIILYSITLFDSCLSAAFVIPSGPGALFRGMDFMMFCISPGEIGRR